MATIDDILEKCAQIELHMKLDAAIARLDAAFRESDHPRDGDGQFATSGSSSGGAASSKPKKLTPTEKTYVSSYSGDDFLRVNRELRAGKSSDPAVKHIDTAIAKSPLPKGSVLYRGMTREAARRLFANGEIKKGETISDPAFSSTSKSANEAEARGLGGVVLKIEAGGNATGLDMKEHARNASEEEVLLPRNAKMKVVGVTAPKSPGDPVIVRVAYGEEE
jgi:hypothetical protein